MGGNVNMQKSKALEMKREQRQIQWEFLFCAQSVLKRAETHIHEIIFFVTFLFIHAISPSSSVV
jgi:hypothetical protein